MPQLSAQLAGLFGIRRRWRQTHQTAEQVMIGASAELHVANMADDYLLGHAGGAVEHYVFGAPAIDVLQFAQERNHRCDAVDASHGLHLERFDARMEALVDLLQSEEACYGSEINS